jgi:uncharacterized protein (DUF1501 family)
VDGLHALGDQQVAEGVAVALGDRDGLEVVGAVTRPRWAVARQSTAHLAHPLQTTFSVHPA